MWEPWASWREAGWSSWQLNWDSESAMEEDERRWEAGEVRWRFRSLSLSDR